MVAQDEFDTTSLEGSFGCCANFERVGVVENVVAAVDDFDFNVRVKVNDLSCVFYTKESEGVLIQLQNSYHKRRRHRLPEARS